ATSIPQPHPAPQAPAPNPAAPNAPAAPVPRPSLGESDVNQDIPIGTPLGGYEVLQKLGAGGMGAVYLARQVSLDRNIALKTLHSQLAKDPQLVSRFTREAYAAAQLTHHNIVQIHDIGQDKDVNFFSMEFVNGNTLANVLRESGKLDVETGVSYILQAARGLKFAHDHGLIHRDVKPENLLLNEQGIVKVADLGLVKRMGGHETENMQHAQALSSGVAVTQVNKSMGTPLYMPPEQAMDAAQVDHRADIYSLGCTLYHLVTGRPPFMGRTAMEVITKHQHEPLTPPDVVVKDLPAALTPIITRMLAKHPDGRYANMKDVIDALEGFLGVASAGPYTPKDDQVKVLEYAAEQYHKNFFAALKPKLVLAFYAACLLLAVLFAYTADDLVWKINLAGGMIGLAVLTTVAYHLTVGVMKRTLLFGKVRQLIFGAGIIDWLLWAAGLAIFAFALYAFSLYVPWLVAAIVAFGLAQGFYWGIDFAASRDREKYLAQAESLIKQMRLKGLDETAIRQFVCKFSGRHWEEFFENLFGYEAKLYARSLWGKERGRDRPKFAAWREPVIAYIQHRIDSRKQLREARLLARLEQKSLESKGVNEQLARRQAGLNARRLVGSAELLRRESRKPVATTIAPPSAKATAAPHSSAGNKTTAVSMSSVAMTMITSGDAAAAHPELDDHAPGYSKQSYFRRRYGTPIQFATSSLLRVGLGLLLLGVYANWWNLNKAGTIVEAGREIASIKPEDAVKRVISGDTASAAKLNATKSVSVAVEKPVVIPLIPARLTKYLEPTVFAIAGLMLLIGAAYRGVMLGIAMYLSAFVAVWGSQINVPGIGYPHWVVAALAAAGLWLFAVIFLRVQND
ncbi:MAG: protein kinase, partial [Burkholderiales bacterium]|nr:protein kinase [Phycisphaerae bacterium]